MFWNLIRKIGWPPTFYVFLGFYIGGLIWTIMIAPDVPSDVKKKAIPGVDPMGVEGQVLILGWLQWIGLWASAFFTLCYWLFKWLAQKLYRLRKPQAQRQ